MGNENSIQILQQSNKAILLNNEKNQLKWISLLSLLFYKKPWQLLAKKKFIASSRNDSRKRNFSSLFLHCHINVHFHIHKFTNLIFYSCLFWHLYQGPSQTRKNFKYEFFKCMISWKHSVTKHLKNLHSTMPLSMYAQIFLYIFTFYSIS